MCKFVFTFVVSFSDNEEENVAMETQESGAVQEIELHPPPKVAIISNTVSKYPGVPHKWLCEGRLLHLMEPTLPANMGYDSWILFWSSECQISFQKRLSVAKWVSFWFQFVWVHFDFEVVIDFLFFFSLFHDHWSRGQPVLISNSARHLNQNLWHPKAFLKDFGHLKHDLVNCLSGKTVPKAPLDKFWKVMILKINLNYLRTQKALFASWKSLVFFYTTLQTTYLYFCQYSISTYVKRVGDTECVKNSDKIIIFESPYYFCIKRHISTQLGL